MSSYAESKCYYAPATLSVLHALPYRSSQRPVRWALQLCVQSLMEVEKSSKMQGWYMVELELEHKLA